MRLNACPSCDTSSRPVSGISAASRRPLEICSAAWERRVIGSTIRSVSITFRITNSTAKTTVSELMKVTKAWFALRIGRSIGTETICAPMISFIFQPKPLFGP